MAKYFTALREGAEHGAMQDFGLPSTSTAVGGAYEREALALAERAYRVYVAEYGAEHAVSKEALRRYALLHACEAEIRCPARDGPSRRRPRSGSRSPWR